MAFVTGFQEHEDSPMESGNRSGELSFTRVFLTAWNDRWSFISELFSSGPFGLPASYSSYWPGVLADTFSISRIVNAPDSVTISDPNFTQLTHSSAVAKITVTYTPIDVGQPDPGEEAGPAGTWVTYSQSSTTTFKSLPGRALQWLSDSVALPPDVVQSVPDTNTVHTVTWHQVTSPPWVTLNAMAGTVNETAFRLPGSPMTFAPGTLLFEGLDDETTIKFGEQEFSRKLELRFVEQAQKTFTGGASGGAGAGTIYGWNYQYRVDTGAYDKPVNDSGDKMFATYEFNNLWTANS